MSLWGLWSVSRSKYWCGLAEWSIDARDAKVNPDKETMRTMAHKMSGDLVLVEMVPQRKDREWHDV